MESLFKIHLRSESPDSGSTVDSDHDTAAHRGRADIDASDSIGEQQSHKLLTKIFDLL